MRQDIRQILEQGIPADPIEWEDALEQFEQTYTTARLAELGTRAAAIGHELRQPLFTISMATENLRLMMESNDLPRPKMELAIDRIAEQVQRAQTIIARVLDTASGAEVEASLGDPGQAIDNAVRFLDDLFARADVVVRRHPYTPHVLVPFAGIQLEQIFVNVLQNAVDSIQLRRRQGWIGEGQIGIGFVLAEDGLRCLICDNGAGLSKNTAKQAFRPFFTTKSNNGTGLGLYISERMLARAGGGISLQAREGQGARVEITLPATAASWTAESGDVVSQT